MLFKPISCRNTESAVELYETVQTELERRKSVAKGFVEQMKLTKKRNRVISERRNKK